jgi:hypothetical protein
MAGSTGAADQVADRRVRRALGAAAVVAAVIAVLFVLQVPWAIAVLPLPGRLDMSNIFIASILLAAAASAGWCLLVGSDRAVAGVALDTVTIFAPAALFWLSLAVNGGGSEAVAFTIGSVLVTGFGTWLLLWARRHPWRDPRPTPRLVLGSFALFIVGLLLASALLIAQVPDVLPWSVTPQLSTLYGVMFLGASAYFAYGLVERRWENAGGQLAGFLAYDLVLIVPFVRQLTAGPDSSDYAGASGLPINLIVYTGVVVFSGAVAAYQLFIDPRTRFRIGTRALAEPEQPEAGRAAR